MGNKICLIGIHESKNTFCTDLDCGDGNTIYYPASTVPIMIKDSNDSRRRHHIIPSD